MESMTFQRAVGHVLDRLRHEHGLTRTEVARRASVSRTTYARQEAGAQVASLETLEAIALAFEVPLSRLISAAEDLQHCGEPADRAMTADAGGAGSTACSQPTRSAFPVSQRSPAPPAPVDLRLGRWQDVLADVGSVDALIVDAPYSARTHVAYRSMPSVGREAITYSAWDSDDVDRFVAYWAPRTRGWFATLTDHNLAPAWEAALTLAGRYVFAPLACMEPGSRVRLSGDGPAQWSVQLIVSRPKNRTMQKWGALPGGYVVEARDGWRGVTGGRSGVMGGKPLSLMRALVRDYSRPGDLICDPCAGGGTTLLAAAIEGRRAVGAEVDPAHFEIAQKRFARGYTPDLFTQQPGAERPVEQISLDIED
jgi:site-specific DNA-methyltransferase (adenine-specific)